MFLYAEHEVMMCWTVDGDGDLQWPQFGDKTLLWPGQTNYRTRNG